MPVKNSPTQGLADNSANLRPEVAKTYSEMVRRVPYTSRDQLQRQSEFAKPYANDGYQAMEHWAPPFYSRPYIWGGPEGPTGESHIETYYDFDTPADDVPPGEEPKINACVLACDKEAITDCTKEYICALGDSIAIEVFKNITHPEPYDDLSTFDVNVYLRNSKHRDQVCGGGWPVGSDEIVITFPKNNRDNENPPGVGTVHLEAIMDAIKCKDIIQWGLSTCIGDLRIECPKCSCDQEENPFEFDDDNTPDTIAPETTISVYVTGGCPPFLWEVSGTGFDFTDAETEDRTNTLEADVTACGAAMLTITDSCSTVINASIRGTEGSWVQIDVDVCHLSGAGDIISGSGTADIYTDLISGNQKQWQYTKFVGCGGGGCVICDAYCTGVECVPCLTNAEYGVPCADPASPMCGVGYDGVACWRAYQKRYYEWQC